MSDSNWLSDPVKKGPVSRLVLDRIKEALINQELKPGDFLPSELELAQKFGVGKSSVREAIKMLEAMGVIQIKRGQGMMICEIPVQNTVDTLAFQLLIHQGEVQDIVDVRTMFEIAYTIIAMDKADEEDLKKIEQSVKNLEQKIEQGVQTLEDDIDFHRSILYSTHNPYIERIGETIMQLFFNSIKKSVRNTPELVLSDHRKIFEAILQRDESAVRSAIQDSISRWKENI